MNEDDPSNMGIGTINSYNLFSYCSNNPVNGYDPTGQWDWGVFWDVTTTYVAARIAVDVGIFTFLITTNSDSFWGAAKKGVIAGMATFGAINNTANAVYYNYISDTTTQSSTPLPIDDYDHNSNAQKPKYSTYTEEYVTRWDILDHTKVMTKEPTYNINAWRYKSEYSIHMYGWYATGWALDMNIPWLSEKANSFRFADIDPNAPDSRLEAQIGTTIFGIFGL